MVGGRVRTRLPVPALPGGRPPRMSLLPDAERFRRLIDGSSTGAAAAAARLGLATLAVPYGVGVAIRNVGFDRGVIRRHAVGVPVISVGNLTLGGTGKTPLVAWVARLVRRHGITPAIVSRGYGARPGTTSDEAAELAVVLDGILHIADRNRVAAATRAAEQGAGAVILDDGFQHRRLGRDLDIVAIDATDPFGCDHLFPRGLLREPLASLERADAVVLTRADAVDETRRAEIRHRFETACRGRTPAVWAEATHAAVRLRSWDGAERPVGDLAHRRVVACAAIGNPAAFRRTLATLHADVAAFRSLPDHHAYVADDVERLADDVRRSDAALVATTLKDLVKLRRTEIAGRPLVAVEIELRVSLGRPELEQAIVGAITGDRSGP